MGGPYQEGAIAMSREARKIVFCFTIFVSMLSIAVHAVRAQCSTLTNIDGEPAGYLFGAGVSTDLDRIAVGAPGAFVGGVQETGAIYVYRLQGVNWVHEAKVYPPTPTAFYRMGYNVDISGLRLITGAAEGGSTYGPESGAAHIFHRPANSWLHEQLLIPSDGAAGHWFGASVALENDRAVVGAPYVDGAGAAYVFKLEGTNWIEETKLTGPPTGSAGGFGWSAAIHGDTIIVGASDDDADTVEGTGAAYVFRLQGATWVQEAKLTAPDGMYLDRFGSSVAISGDVVVVGAHDNDAQCPSFNDEGSAYVFERQGGDWQHTATLDPGGDACLGGIRFGIEVAIDGDLILVGAYNENIPPTAYGAGTAYVFRRAGSNWVQVARLTAPAPTENQHFGNSVATGSGRMVVGSIQQRKAYVFGATQSPNDCNYNCLPDATELQTGAAMDCNANSIPDGCDLAACLGDPDCGDCDFNAIPDGCDRAACAPADPDCSDCNGNEIMDSCDIRTALNNPLLRDCNANSRPDSCDLFDASESDVNANDIPDSCECELFQPGIELVSPEYYLSHSVSATPDRIATAGGHYVKVFRREDNDWQEEADLSWLGAANARVAIHGETLLVGDPQASPFGLVNAGAVDVVRFDGANWIFETQLTSADASGSEWLGTSLSLVGDIAVVGAPLTSHFGISVAGAVVVFRRDVGGWVEEATLTASDAQVGDQFGNAVAFDGTRAIIGAEEKNVATGNGAAYVFRRDGMNWVEEARLTSFYNVDNFGKSVAINGNVAVVGSIGRAYTFYWDGNDWIEEVPALEFSDEIEGGGAEFGWSVAMSESQLLVGGPTPIPFIPGFAYLYERVGTSWTVLARFASPSSPFGEIEFGNSVAISADVAAIGTDGSAYVFDAKPADCNANGDFDSCEIAVAIAQDCNTNAVPDACDIESGNSMDITGNGIPDECECSPPDCGDGDACTLDSCQIPGLFCNHAPLMTLKFGDVNNDTVVNLDDILCVVGGFGGHFTSACPKERVDLVPCPVRDGLITLDDILGVLTAFSGGVSAGCSADLCAP